MDRRINSITLYDDIIDENKLYFIKDNISR